MMNKFAIKGKHSTHVICKSHPSRFGYRRSEVKGQQAMIHRILRSNGAQTKLSVGQPSDVYEQEAARPDDRVMSMPDTRLQRQPEDEEEEETLQPRSLADQITPLVQRQEEPPEEEEEEPVQAKFGASSGNCCYLIKNSQQSIISKQVKHILLTRNMSNEV